MQYNKQQGQTLVETMIGIFILVMGIVAAVGLASYSFSASTSIVKQLVGTGLAREGVEAVKNMRDTNWLKGSLSNTCWNYQTSDATANCYHDWQNAFYGASGTRSLTAGTYKLDFDPLAADTAAYWQLTTEASNFQLYYDATASSGRYYTTSTVGTVSSGYFRQIVISEESPAYTVAPSNIGPRIRVAVYVWWTDKGCSFTQVFPGQGRCGVRLETFLTNWRNY